MDTHIANAPDLDQVGAPLGSPIRLPGARGTLPHPGPSRDEAEAGILADPHAASTTEQGETAEVPKPPGRKWLLATVAAVVLAGAGGVAWTVRQGILVLPPQVSALVQSAKTFAGAQTASEVGVAASQPVVGTASAPVKPADVSEFAELKLHDGAAEVGVSPARPPVTKAEAPAASSASQAAMTVAAPVVAPVVVAVSPPSSELPASSAAHDAASTSPPSATPAQTPAAVLAQAPAGAPAETPTPPPVKPRDPVQVAATLHAAPLAPKQQVETVGLVRELGAQLMETRLLVTQLGATVAELKQQVETRVTEFDGRLMLAEAGTVLARSAQAGKPVQAPSPALAAAPTHQAAPDRSAGSDRSTGPASPRPVTAAPRSVKDFRIQGASPGLVVLNVLNPAAGEVPVLYLALGEPVPGLGRVKSIYQRGTSWLVQTDAGVIQ